MLQIDGSYGEGGGQILRNAVALSVLTKKPVEIKNIRAKRPNPGIKAQHHTAISCMKALCDAKTEGLFIGSSSLKFTPGEIHTGEYEFDIGTAGSMTLVFQTCILCSLKATKPVIIKLTGGTDVKWSPSWDYFVHVFLPLICKMGVNIDVNLIQHGYYPKGGGEAVLTVHPCKKIHPLKLGKKQNFTTIQGIIHISSLPDHIGKRMKHAAIKTLLKKDLESDIKIENVASLSPGTGITLWSQSDKSVLGSTVTGEKGVPSERIGESAAIQLLKEIDSDANLDIYAIDQILPYMALASNIGKSCCIVRRLSSHTKTNMWIIQQFFDTTFEIVKQDNSVRLAVNV